MHFKGVTEEAHRIRTADISIYSIHTGTLLFVKNYV